MTEFYNFVLGNGFDSSNLKGAWADGYNGEGSFNNPYANIAWSATNDLLNFATLGLGGAAKNVISSSAKAMDNIFFAVTPKHEKMVTVTSWAEKRYYT